MTPDRAARVAHFIRGELANIVQTRLRDPRAAMLTVTDARVSRDLAYADVYVSSPVANDAERKGDLVDVLNRAAGFLRTALAGRHAMRATPKLRFHYDDTPEEGARLDALIDSAVLADRAAAENGHGA